MNLAIIWQDIKPYLDVAITYIFPTAAVVLSGWAFIDSRKANKLNGRIAEIEEKLKTYELEAIEKEREKSAKACIEARIYQMSAGKYRMKFWNSGKATACNVDFTVPETCKSMVLRDKVPYEELEPNKSFDEIMVMHMGSSNKFAVTTSWQDAQGNSHSKEQTVSI